MMGTARLFRAALPAAALFAVAASGVAFAVYGDIVFKRKGTSAEDAVEILPAVFPHWFHRIRFRCAVCHDDIIVMKRGANPITMDAIREGKFCGRCHNGRIAWGLAFDVCTKCHTSP